MATLRQKKTLNDTIDNIKNGAPLTKGEILLKNNYSVSVAKRPSTVYDSKFFKTNLDKVNENKILEKWQEWATDGKDRRVAVQCGREIMLLKDRYPAQKSKVIGLFDKITNLDDEREQA